MKYSLCIPTMRRWGFLEKYIPLYLENPYIDEIVIVDETGEDYAKIVSAYSSEAKIRVYQNEKCLGPFLNKLKCMKYASNDWICLVDSDNFVDLDYFKMVSALEPLDEGTVYLPSFAAPDYDYREFNGLLLTKDFIAGMCEKESYKRLEMCLNTGNYVISKKSVEYLSLYESDEFSKVCFTCDVLYSNYLLLKNGIKLYIVPELSYSHVVHEDSIFLKKSLADRHINEYMYSTFRSYLEEP